MLSTEDRPSIGERYATAIETSNMRVRPLEMGGCDADVIAAAGMAKDYRGKRLDPMATRLYRLRCEFDSVKAAKKLGKAPSMTDRLFVLMELRSLSEVQQNLNDIAIGFAVDMGYIDVQDDGTVVAKVDEQGRKIGKDLKNVFAATNTAIDLWLSPLCHDCNGVGKIGALGKPQHVCGTCGGSGRRDSSSMRRKSGVFRDAADMALGRKLLAEMDRLVASVEYALKQQLYRVR